ncbi:MAG: hypothetical protein IPJ69_07090 [Deltaproteobacteria bacterium]|nr:MAG: hypothetical protein IPJ69_07090 [Deltaproteobacteria bacterium]
MKTIKAITVVSLFVTLAASQAWAKKFVQSDDDYVPRNKRPTVAVTRMRGEWIALHENTAQSLKDIANDSCVKNGLRCLERQDLDAVREEQDLAASGDAAPGQKRAKKGKLTTADVLVSCALTGSTGDAAGVGVAVNNRVLNTIGLKGVGVSTDRVTMTCRAVDSSTGEIILSKTTNKMAATTELAVFNYKSSMAKAVEKSMDAFFKELKNQL